MVPSSAREPMAYGLESHRGFVYLGALAHPQHLTLLIIFRYIVLEAMRPKNKVV